MDKENISIEQLLEDDREYSQKLGLDIWEKSHAKSIDEAKKFVSTLPTPDEFQELGELFKKKYDAFLPSLEFDSFELLSLLTKK